MSGLGITDPTERTKPMAPQIEMPGLLHFRRASLIFGCQSLVVVREIQLLLDAISTHTSDSTDRVIDRAKHTGENQSKNIAAPVVEHPRATKSDLTSKCGLLVKDSA